jgi:UDP-N-acetylglucosamine acyltransferase
MSPLSMNVKQIRDVLAQSYPSILIDRVELLEPGKKIIALKNVTINEDYFRPEVMEPVLPVVMQQEIMAQAASILLLKTDEFQGEYITITSIEQAKFLKPVVPGDTLRIEVNVERINVPEARCRGRILLNNETVAEAQFTLKAVTLRAEHSYIDRTAVVHSTVKLGQNVRIGPYAIVDERSVIGDNTIIDAHVVIGAGTIIGKDCHLHYGAIIGDLPQDLKYAGEPTNVVIGERCHIREYVTISRATGPGNKTVLGDDNFLMSHVHVGHNCHIGNKVVIVSLSHLAGHVIVEDNVVIGGMVGIPQFLRIGKMAMIGGYSRLFQDIPPFMLAEGNPADVQTINLVGLKRNGVKREVIDIVKDAYRLIYRSGLNLSQSVEKIKQECLLNGAQPAEIQHLLNFIKGTVKGINRRETSTSLLSSENSGLPETESFFDKVRNILVRKRV